MIYILVSILTFGAIALLLNGLLPARQEGKVGRSLDRLQAYDVGDFRSIELSPPLIERLLGPRLGRLSRIGELLTPDGRLGRLRQRVEQAGRPAGLDVNGLLTIKVLALAAGLLVAVIVSSLRLLPSELAVLLGITWLVLSYYSPDLVLRTAVSNRQQQISRTLPDFIDLLTVCVEAGLGLDAALARIAEKLPGPMREEILITLHHMRIGESREVALREFGRRTGVKEVEVFVTALIQSQKLGISLGKVLRTQSENMRIVRRQTIEERAQKMPVKLVFPTILCIFPSLFVVILGPAAIRIYDALLGGLG